MKKIFGEDYLLIKDDSLEDYIYRIIPLNIIKNDNNSLFMSKEFFHESLKKIVLKKKTLWDIAELSLELIEGYIRHEPNTFNNNHICNILEGFSIKSDLEKIFSLLSYSNETYKKDLCNLMILSYIYNEGNITIKKKNDQLIYYLELLRGKENLLKDNNYVISTRLYSEKKYNYTGKKCDAKHKNYLLTAFFNKKFFLDNIFDIEIILSLLSLTKKKKNPFCHQEIINDKYSSDIDTNIKFFLKNLNKLSLNDNHKSKYLPNLFDIFQKNINNSLSIVICARKNNKIYAYNQFMLERILNLNFINQLYLLDNTINSNITYALSDWIISPLLKTRLELLSFIMENHTRLDFSNKHFGNNTFKDIMQRLNEYQIHCIIPLAITTFYYLMKLKMENINDKVSKKLEIFLREEYDKLNDKSKSFETWHNNTNNYIKNEYEQKKITQTQKYFKKLEDNYFKKYLEENTFFIFNKKTDSIEENIVPIVSQKKTPNYNPFVNKQILNFEKLSIKDCQYSFKECLDIAIQNLPQFLKQEIIQLYHQGEDIIPY